MSSNKITELINLYFDGELDKGREAFLFTELSQSLRDGNISNS
jgi:hypothetical protein